MTLKCLDRAFQALRRVRDGEPFVPALQGARALQRLGNKTHGDGWRLVPGEGGRHGRLRVAGVGLVKMRGKPRNEGEPKTREIVHRRGRSCASVTVECTPKRCQQGAGLHWGGRDPCHARHFGGETVRVENPRHLKNALWSEPLARNRVKARQRVAALHEKIANRRQLLAQEEFSR